VSLDKVVVSFVDLVDLVSQPPPAPGLNVVNLAAVGGQDLGKTLNDLLLCLFFDIGTNDKSNFVFSHVACRASFLWDCSRLCRE